jgi:hypothetical protein
VSVISKEQAEHCAEALLQVARAESDARLEHRREFRRYPELRGWPASRREALWREAMAATRWNWPVMVVAALVIVPNVVLLSVAALSLAHLKPGTVPYFLCFLTPLGVIAIQRVHGNCAQRYLRSMSQGGSIDRSWREDP